MDTDATNGIKIATLTGVREYAEGYSVELRLEPETGRPVIVAWNEGHNNLTQVDLGDLVTWLSHYQFGRYLTRELVPRVDAS